MFCDLQKICFNQVQKWIKTIPQIFCSFFHILNHQTTIYIDRYHNYSRSARGSSGGSSNVKASWSPAISHNFRIIFLLFRRWSNKPAIHCACFDFILDNFIKTPTSEMSLPLTSYFVTSPVCHSSNFFFKNYFACQFKFKSSIWM